MTNCVAEHDESLYKEWVKTKHDALNRAIKHAQGVTSFAEKMGVHQTTVSMWKRRGGIPADRALDVERVTDGEVTAEQVLVEYQQRRAEARA